MQKNVNGGVNVIAWSDSYRIGLSEIDDQHKSLVELMNDLWGAIAANASNQECDRIFEQLEIYTVAHFGAEETMMQALAYPNLAEHRLAHREFVQRIKRERASLQAGQRLGLDITHFLRDWLVKHILVNDRAYADFYEQKSKPSGFLGRFFSRFRSNDLTHG